MPPVVTIHTDAVSNLGDFCRAIPLVCQGYFSPYFHDLYGKACKYFSAKHAAEEFERMHTNGTIPASLNSIRTPTLQVSAEFRNGGGHHPRFSGIENAVRIFRRSMIDHFKDAKLEEAAFFYDRWLSPAKIQEQVDPIVVDMAAKLCQTHAVEQVTDLPPDLAKTVNSWKGGEAAACASQVIELARLKSLAGYEKTSRKRKAKADVDIEMTGASAGDADVKSLEKTVARVLARQEQSRRDKKRASKTGITPLCESSAFELLLLTSQRTKKPCKWSPARRTHFLERTVTETAEMNLSAPRSFSLTNLSTYPRGFFTGSLESRILFVKMKLSLDKLLSLRFLNYPVHKGPGVELPRHIEYYLAVNLKYLYPQIMNFSAAGDSFPALVNDVRRRIHQQRKPPEYTLPYEMGRRMPEREYSPVDDNVEAGLAYGRNRLYSMQSHIVPTRPSRREPEPFLTELRCSLTDLQMFLSLNRYMTFITDKNLGLSVVPQNWYHTQVEIHLASDSYRRLSPNEGVPWDWITRLCNEFGNMEAIPLDIQAFLEESPKRLQLPAFHGIPKIHKSPWKLRPIVPMHSYRTSHLAMVVHHYLYPFTVSCPWICHSSKDFVRDILLASRGKKGLRIFSGDVRSMYTNIETKELLFAIRTLCANSLEPPLLDWLLDVIEFLNDSVYFQYNQTIFQQTKGIAMGLACGPTLANLFMGFWEKVHDVDTIYPFYRRYIDDVLLLSEDDTVYLGQNFVPGLDIDWVSAAEMPFLDCLVHSHDGEICVRPYVKALSHYQYVPWSSGHPIHVKRGLVKTELLRYSRLSAKRQYFDEARAKLGIVLRARGYPAKALKAWMRQVQWRDPRDLPPLTEPDGRPRPLNVKSEYNPLWNHLPLDTLWEEMTRVMTHYGDRTQTSLPISSGLRKSLKRTMSLWDVVRRVNRNLQQRQNTMDMEDANPTDRTQDAQVPLGNPL